MLVYRIEYVNYKTVTDDSKVKAHLYNAKGRLKLSIGAIHPIVQLLLRRWDVQIQLWRDVGFDCVDVIKTTAPSL